MALTPPSKLVSERISLTFNFSDEMEWAETISSVLVFVFVLTGTDPDPGLLFYQVWDIDGQTVVIQVQEGLPGVIYEVQIRIVGSSGNTYTKYAKVAVLPDAAELPQSFATFLTTQTYPYFFREGIDSLGYVSAGNLTRLILTYESPPEGIDTSVLIPVGNLRDPYQIYTIPPEGVDSSVTISAGILRSPLILYTAPPEGINSSASVSAGVLDQILVTYTAPPEGIDSSITVSAGSLT